MTSRKGDATVKILEIRKRAYCRDVYLFGRRIATFPRKKSVYDAILHHLMWQADYRTLRQHGIELPGESAYYWTGHYEIANVRLGELRRFWKGSAVPLGETDLGRFAKGGHDGGLRAYYEEMARMTNHSAESVAESVAESERLFAKLETSSYDPSVCCITVNGDNVILDGFHRSCFLLAKHGPDSAVKVVRVLPDFR